MVGQGSPRTSILGFFGCVCKASGRASTLALLLLQLCCFQSILSASEPLRLRVAWGGGSERIWHGTIAVNNGTLSDPVPLGIEADEPGSMWAEDGKIIVRQRSGRSYDGVDLTVDAPLESKLLIDFMSEDGEKSKRKIEVPIADLLNDFANADMDDQGNKFLIRRSPGDSLRVKLARRSLVFLPGETFRCEVVPYGLPVGDDTEVEVRAKLVVGRGSNVLWESTSTIKTGSSEAVPFSVKMPSEDGVYDLVFSARHSGSIRFLKTGRVPLGWKKTFASRKIQVVVVGAEPTPSSEADQTVLKEVVQIDPANNKWWEGFAKLSRLTRFWNGPLGSERKRIRKHPLGDLVELLPNGKDGQIGWEAYSLPIERTGVPHILEVNYPSDISQTMGISIIEPDAAGALMPIGLDSGVDVSKEVVGQTQGEKPRWMRHRLIFWPRTQTPIVLITNHQEDAPAIFGKIRVLAGWEHLPRAFPEDQSRPGRLFGVYLDRPLFAETFSGSESIDEWSKRSLDDWRTFYEGGNRLAEYLNYIGFGGAMISVLADGSTVYPSDILEPTPRFDKGVFFASGQDPVRKDILEMLFRLFDREKLQLVPAIEFSTPLPQLESMLRRGDSETEGIELVGPDGRTWKQTHGSRRGLAPHYNVLNSRVQEAMLAVVRELAGEYSEHESFTGLAIQLSADGYAQLPGPDWGLDDDTIKRFERDTKIKVPGDGADRFAIRSEFFAENPNRQRWLEWRAAELGRFYAKVQAELAAFRPCGRLYLAGAKMFDSENLEYQLRPMLPRRMTVAEAMLYVGIEVARYQSQEKIILLRPESVEPRSKPSDDALRLELKQMSDWDQTFRGLPNSGSLFFHRPQKVRLTSFDQKSPYQPSYTWLVSHPVPSGHMNRRRFVHSLATLDSQAIFDGGWLLSLGQEDAIRELVGVFNKLPDVRFSRLSTSGQKLEFQPVVARYATYKGSTYLYVVNDSPLSTTAKLRMVVPPGCLMDELTGKRAIEPLGRDSSGDFWNVELKPYDLVAVRLSSSEVTFFAPEASVSGDVLKALGNRIDDLGARVAALRNPPKLQVPGNSDFEGAIGDDGKMPGWVVETSGNAVVELDKSEKFSGDQSAKLTSKGSVVSLVSEPFAILPTGRLAVGVWLRVEDVGKQVPLRLAVSGKLNGCEYYRFASLGLGTYPNMSAKNIGTEWAQYVFQVDDLPLKGLEQLCVRFDLMGKGQVWIDQVQVYHLMFTSQEVMELSKMVTLADKKRRDGQVSDCIRFLEGYWPRFLEENVPLRHTVAQRSKTEKTVATRQRKPSTVVDRLKELVPKKLW